MNERMDLQGPGRFRRRALTVADARTALLAAVPGPDAASGTEAVPLWEAAGRVLAEEVAATTDWPPFARSGMDGYAVRSADVAHATPEAPVVLRVLETVGAGSLARGPVLPGTAVRIMTGAAVPAGADAVVMLEQTAGVGDGSGDRHEAAAGLSSKADERAGATAGTDDATGSHNASDSASQGKQGADEGADRPEGEAPGSGNAMVAVKMAVEAGRNIAPAGEEFRLGDAVAASGTVLRPGHVAVFGLFGLASVRVYRRPRVAVFATGTELLPVDAPLEPGRIRDSNSAMVAALAAGCGAAAQPMGCLPDDPDTVAAAIASAMEWADAVVTTGGISVGDFDVMAALLARLGTPGCGDGRVLFNKVAMRPGSPTSAAMIGGKPLLALSGNPAACFVGFHLFAGPVIRRLQGHPFPLPAERTAELASPVAKPSPHDRYVRVRLLERGGRLYADPLGFDKSGMTASLPEAEALARIPAGSQGLAAGTMVTVMPL